MFLKNLQLDSAVEATVTHCHFLIFKIRSVPFVIAAFLAVVLQALITLHLFSFIKYFVPKTRRFFLPTGRFRFEIIFTTWASFTNLRRYLLSYDRCLHYAVLLWRLKTFSMTRLEMMEITFKYIILYLIQFRKINRKLRFTFPWRRWRRSRLSAHL